MHTTNSTTRQLWFLFLTICLCFLTACADTKAKNDDGNDDIFQYAVKFEDGKFSPKAFGYAMSINEVLKTKNLTEDALDYSQGEDDPRIINTITIKDLSDEIKEIFFFHKDQLVTVEYVIPVTDTDFENVCQALQTQADALLPSDLLMNDANKIADAQTTSWMDEQENTIEVSFPSSDLPDKKIIILDLHAARSLITK